GLRNVVVVSSRDDEQIGEVGIEDEVSGPLQPPATVIVRAGSQLGLDVRRITGAEQTRCRSCCSVRQTGQPGRAMLVSAEYVDRQRRLHGAVNDGRAERTTGFHVEDPEGRQLAAGAAK